MTDIAKAAQESSDLALWQAYCEKKMALEDAADEIKRLRKALRSIANNTGCVEACPCWAKLRHKAIRALLEDGR